MRFLYGPRDVGENNEHRVTVPVGDARVAPAHALQVCTRKLRLVMAQRARATPLAADPQSNNQNSTSAGGPL